MYPESAFRFIPRIELSGLQNNMLIAHQTRRDMPGRTLTRISREAGAMVWCNTKLRDKDVTVHNTASDEKFGFLGLAKEVVPHDRHLVAELLRRKIFGMIDSSHS